MNQEDWFLNAIKESDEAHLNASIKMGVNAYAIVVNALIESGATLTTDPVATHQVA